MATIRQCGSSPAEARTQGCILDTLTFAWQVPGRCDTTLIEEVERIQRRKYFYHKNKAALVPYSEVELDLRPVYVRWE